MLPGLARMLTCPSCGAKKEVLSLTSGNTSGARFWSDNYQDAPMMPEVSYIQKCPACHAYFIADEDTMEFGKNPSEELGTLSWPETKEAVKAMLQTRLTQSQEVTVRMMLVHAYNNFYYRNTDTSSDKKEPAPLDRELFIANIHAIYPLLQQGKQGAELLKAELQRECGEFWSCLETLAALHEKGAEQDAFHAFLTEEIIRRAKQKDAVVFEIKD